jgi:hypothetical protein
MSIEGDRILVRMRVGRGFDQLQGGGETRTRHS